MEKPVIRLIHHMARTGGTLICKCLACMKQVIMLSEIHPLGTRMFNPVQQAQTWYQLFSEQEIQDHFSGPVPFGYEDLVVSASLDCAPCYRKRCPEHHNQCMHRIDSSQVARKLAKALTLKVHID